VCVCVCARVRVRVCVCVCRQLFVIYDALPDPSLKHINSVIRSAVVLCAAVYFTVSWLAHLHTHTDVAAISYVNLA